MINNWKSKVTPEVANYFNAMGKRIAAEDARATRTDETCPPKLADGIARALMRDELEAGEAIDRKMDEIELRLREIARKRGIQL